jgi:hypothetical protein
MSHMQCIEIIGCLRLINTCTFCEMSQQDARDSDKWQQPSSVSAGRGGLLGGAQVVVVVGAGRR